EAARHAPLRSWTGLLLVRLEQACRQGSRRSPLSLLPMQAPGVNLALPHIPNRFFLPTRHGMNRREQTRQWVAPRADIRLAWWRTLCELHRVNSFCVKGA